MKISQRVVIPVPKALVWDSLNDPEVLRACLPGCKEFTPKGPDEFDLVVTAKVGPVKATFKGEVALRDVQAPDSYRIEGAGKGGVAGFAKGGATVALDTAPDGDGTVMTYGVEATVGGKLAQIGSRLVMGAARKMADDFFRAFVRHVTGDEEREVELETLSSD